MTIPLPPKKTVEVQVATQALFFDEKLEPLREEAHSGHGHVFFVDAAHFVQGACLWCAGWLFIRGASGRQRDSVLGAWNAVANELVHVTTAGTVSSETMCDLLRQIAAQGLIEPVTLVLYNARYQRCSLVTSLAETLPISLEFLPSDSPNLNLIKRLWKFVKRDVHSGRHDDNVTEFRRAIDGCLDSIPPKHRPQLATLTTHNVQQFNTTSFLTA